MNWLILILFAIVSCLLRGAFNRLIMVIAVIYIYRHYPNVLTDLQHFLEDL
jgi:hypothetical protein